MNYLKQIGAWVGLQGQDAQLGELEPLFIEHVSEFGLSFATREEYAFRYQ